MKKRVLVMFGGISAEHEVSVVTGLQALEHLDASAYEPVPIYVTKRGEFLYMPKLANRKDFLTTQRISISFGRDDTGGFITTGGIIPKKIYPYCAYLAFHGGLGESGSLQGLLESVGIPHTGCSSEGAVIAMNKKLTKESLALADIKTVPDVQAFSEDVHSIGVEKLADNVIKEVGLPAIIKPVHLGSSIGLSVVRNEVELQKGLLEASFTDTEIIVEPFLEGITEFNCAVRSVKGALEASPVERPISHGDILSFADKYERGGSKKIGAGMASLARELPAKISPVLIEKIQNTALRAFASARLSGMARIDFMHDKHGKLYLTEINPIPGSMAFYLWEAAGIPFQTQITDSIEEAVLEADKRNSKRLDYKSDIIERFSRS